MESFEAPMTSDRHGVGQKRVELPEEPRWIVEHDEVPRGVGQCEMHSAEIRKLLRKRLDEERALELDAIFRDLVVNANPRPQHERRCLDPTDLLA